MLLPRNSLATFCLLAGCSSPTLEPLAEGQLRLDNVEIRTGVGGNLDLTEIGVDLINATDAPIVIRVRCTPIEVDQQIGGEWRRLGDLRLCAPPDRTTMPPRTTWRLTDIRGLPPSAQYRLAVVPVDGAEVYSPPFDLPAR